MRMTAPPLLAMLLTAGTAAVAQAPGAAPTEAALPPRYEVEIIVFAHRDFDPTEERFAFAPRSLDAGDAPLLEAPIFDETTFAPPFEAPLAEPPLEALPPEPSLPEPELSLEAQRAAALQVRPLLPEELDLGAEYRRIQALSAYEPLLHTGWVQPGLPENDAQPFELQTLGVLNPSGTVRVHLSRFLHITLDLTYEAPSSTAAGGATVFSTADGLDGLALAPRYRLQTTRSARSGELHYFDHPAFGVLVRVTPVPTPADPGRRPAA